MDKEKVEVYIIIHETDVERVEVDGLLSLGLEIVRRAAIARKADESFNFNLKVCENHENSGTQVVIFVNRDTTGTTASIPGLSRPFRDTWQLCALDISNFFQSFFGIPNSVVISFKIFFPYLFVQFFT